MQLLRLTCPLQLTAMFTSRALDVHLSHALFEGPAGRSEACIGMGVEKALPCSDVICHLLSCHSMCTACPVREESPVSMPPAYPAYMGVFTWGWERGVPSLCFSSLTCVVARGAGGTSIPPLEGNESPRATHASCLCGSTSVGSGRTRPTHKRCTTQVTKTTIEICPCITCATGVAVSGAAKGT